MSYSNDMDVPAILNDFAERLGAVELALTGPQNIYQAVDAYKVNTARLVADLIDRVEAIDVGGIGRILDRLDALEARLAPTGPIVDSERDEINRRLDVELGNLRGSVATLHQLIEKANHEIEKLADFVEYSE